MAALRLGVIFSDSEMLGVARTLFGGGSGQVCTLCGARSYEGGIILRRVFSIERPEGVRAELAPSEPMC
ncbi:MAG: hypothetical protein ACR2NM_02635 [Bythopirellula sp.]